MGNNPFIHPPAHPHRYQSSAICTNPLTFIYTSIHPHLLLSIYDSPSIYPSINPSESVPIQHSPSIHLYPHTHPSIHPSTHLRIPIHFFYPSAPVYPLASTLFEPSNHRSLSAVQSSCRHTGWDIQDTWILFLALSLTCSVILGRSLPLLVPLFLLLLFLYLGCEKDCLPLSVLCPSQQGPAVSWGYRS